MYRRLWIVLLAGCAGAPTPEEGPLDRLISKSNAYTSFRMLAEIGDGKQAVPIEMAFQAPDRALLRYGTVETTIHSGGRVHHFLRGTYSSLDYARGIAELRNRYPGLSLGPAGQSVFTLGDGVRARLWVGRLGARLGWLEDLRAYQATGAHYRHGQTDIEVRDDGFISRTELAGTRFVLKEVSINVPLPDAIFALPPTAGLTDLSARAQADLDRGLDESVHRWILETSISDSTLETLLSTDLARSTEPDKKAAALAESVRKGLGAFRLLHPDSRPEVMRDKLAIDRSRAMGNLEILEEEIQKEYEKALEGYLRGMAVPLPPKDALDLSRRWHLEVKRQIDLQIRHRFEEVFEAALKD